MKKILWKNLNAKEKFIRFKKTSWLGLIAIIVSFWKLELSTAIVITAVLIVGYIFSFKELKKLSNIYDSQKDSL
ncbi:hypothetical protein ACWG0P_03975 [Amedibacillus sp. YH-ame6]